MSLDSRVDHRFHYRRSLASRVTLLTTIAVGIAVTFVALGAYLTARVQLRATLDETLMERAQAAASPVYVEELEAYLDRFSVSGGLPAWALGAADAKVALVAISKDTGVAYTIQIDRGDKLSLGAPEAAVARGDEPSSVRTIEVGGTPYRVAAVPATRDGVAVVVAQSLEPTERVLVKLGIVSLLFGLAGVIAAGVAGWAVARSGLRPVRRLTEKAEEIARTEELDTIPIEGDDEIARLSGAFNQMLLSLAASRDRQRRLVADAGHELRTPLTSLRTNLDLLAQADQSGMVLPEGAREELLEDVRGQVEELTTLVGDLVELARDEPMAQVIESVELAEVLDAALTRVRRRAGVGIAIEVLSDPWTTIGDPSAIERAYTNVLDNAVKWSPSAGTVHVTLLRGVLTVDDEGPGIAEKDLPRVFERFWRSEESRAMPGSGLGLSIVAQVAARHSGTVRAERSPYGGARFVLALPGDPS